MSKILDMTDSITLELLQAASIISVVAGCMLDRAAGNNDEANALCAAEAMVLKCREDVGALHDLLKVSP